MDVNITDVNVQRFNIDTLSYGGVLAVLYLVLITWLLFVASVCSIAVNFHRWRKYAPALGAYVQQE